MPKTIALLSLVLLAACGTPPPPHRSFPAPGPWLAFWGGTAAEAGDLDQLAKHFRVIVMNPDPDNASWTNEQVVQLKANGKNRVLSYLNIGSCERATSYWTTVPDGFVSCGANVAAQRGPYAGYPDETWMDPSNADYQKLILDHVSARLAAFPIDGFFLDNMEIIEHGTTTTNGPCDTACAQGALDLVRQLRERHPDFLIVMNHATGDFTRLGTTGGVAFPTLIDGVNQEGVYIPNFQAELETQLDAWQAMKMTRGGQPFWVATTDYVGGCDDLTTAKSAFDRSRARGFSATATNTALRADVVCYWPF